MGYVLNKQTALSNRQFSPEEGLVPFGNDEFLPHPPARNIDSSPPTFNRNASVHGLHGNGCRCSCKSSRSTFSGKGVVAVLSLFCSIPKKWLGGKRNIWMPCWTHPRKVYKHKKRKKTVHVQHAGQSNNTLSLFIQTIYCVLCKILLLNIK